MKKPTKKKYNNDESMTKNVKTLFAYITKLEVRLYKTNLILFVLAMAVLVVSALCAILHFC